MHEREIGVEPESSPTDGAAAPRLEPLQAALALASTFAEALARKPALDAALAEGLARAIESALVSAGCIWERDPLGGLALVAQAGFAGADGYLRSLCDEAWLLDAVVGAGLPVHLPSERVPRDAATALLQRAGATGALALPLIDRGERLGALVLASRDVDLAAEGAATGARLVASQVARALGEARQRARLEASERLHRTAFELAPDALLILDDDGRIQAANARAEALLDRAAAELHGRRPRDFVVPEDAAMVNALAAQLVAQGSLAVHRMRLRRADDRVVDVDATAARVSGAAGCLRVLVLRDMTNRRGAREGLAAGEERFRALVESTGDVIFTLDRSLRVTGVFGRCPADAGLDDTGCVGKPLGEALGGAAAVHEPAAGRALGGEVTAFEWTLPASDGARHLQTTLSPVRAADGEVRGLVGVTRDVTDRRQLQAGLLVANHMAALGLLAGSLAQELSTPVAAVLTNLSHVNQALAGVQARLATGEPALDVATLIHLGDPIRDAVGAAEQLRRTVQDLRTFTRTAEERLGPIDVGQALDAAVRLAATEVRGRARVVRHYQEETYALANEARLVQVFLSLIINAAQACPDRGEGRHEIRLTARREADGLVVIEVRDTGTGIAPENLGRIFEPFFTTKPPGVGTGLGLSIAQRIVASIGGRIEVETQLGKGTTVRVVLPAAERGAERRSPESSGRTAPAA